MTNAARDLFDTIVVPRFESGHAKEWLAHARATARYLARVNGSVTADQVRAECPPPAGTDPRIMGSLFPRGEFKKVGYVNSERGVNHGRPIAQFALVNA